MAKTKQKFFTRVAGWFRGMKKVVWPTPKQTTNNSLVVLAVCGASAVVLWGCDELASGVVRILITLFG